MPIQVPNSNGTFSDLKEIYVGRDSISKVYSGGDLVWSKDIVQISLPSSTDYNTDLRTNWLAYNQWRNQTGNCYFQINGWEINKIKCPTLSGMRSKSGTEKSNSEFEANYMASPVHKYGGKYYTLISDSSVVSGYFPLTFTFQTYSLGRPGNNYLNNFFFITTANTTSNGRLDTSYHTSSDLLRVRDDIKKSHVYLIPNSNTQRNITIGAKDKTGDYNQGRYTGHSPQLFDNDVTPMFGQFSGRDINSKNGRVIPLANDSGLDTKNGHRDNTRTYWEDFSTNDAVFDQASFNCQISVTMMAKVDDWTDKDISFVQIYSVGADTGNKHLTLFNFDAIRSMQKVNFCLLTESQYVDKVAGGSFYSTNRVNYTNFPQTAYGDTEDLSTYTRWQAESPQPPVPVITVIEDTTDDNFVTEVQVIEPLDTADIIPEDLGHLQFRYFGTQGRLDLSFTSNGTIVINGISDGGKILAGDDLTQIASNETGNSAYSLYSWHEQTNSLVGEKYEISATHQSGSTPSGPIDGTFKSLETNRKFQLITSSEAQSTIKFRLRKVADQSIVSEWTTLLDVYQDPNVIVDSGGSTGGVQIGSGSSTTSSIQIGDPNERFNN